MKTVTVKFSRPHIIGGKLIEPGAEVTVSRSEYESALHAGVAVEVVRKEEPKQAPKRKRK